MPTFNVDPSWYERTWLTEHPPSRGVWLSRRARAAAHRLRRGLIAVAAMA